MDGDRCVIDALKTLLTQVMQGGVDERTCCCCRVGSPSRLHLHMLQLPSHLLNQRAEANLCWGPILQCSLHGKTSCCEANWHLCFLDGAQTLSKQQEVPEADVQCVQSNQVNNRPAQKALVPTCMQLYSHYIPDCHGLYFPSTHMTVIQSSSHPTAVHMCLCFCLFVPDAWLSRQSICSCVASGCMPRQSPVNSSLEAACFALQ